MIQIDVLAAGKIKSGPFYELWSEYAKRLPWKINLIEVEARSMMEEHKKLEKKLAPGAFVIALDERGQPLASRAFSALLDDLVMQGRGHIQFVIGGADGLSSELRKKADLLLSFGIQTWPHKLVRVMLIEQIYRAGQIQAGHPYHRD